MSGRTQSAPTRQRAPRLSQQPGNVSTFLPAAPGQSPSRTGEVLLLVGALSERGVSGCPSGAGCSGVGRVAPSPEHLPRWKLRRAAAAGAEPRGAPGPAQPVQHRGLPGSDPPQGSQAGHPRAPQPPAEAAKAAGELVVDSS